VSRKTKFIEVVTDEKIDGDGDMTGVIKGTTAPRAAAPELGGRSADNLSLFECPWCGAINYTEETRAGAFYVCFACHRPMRPALA